MTAVFDASAILAWLQREPGGDTVAENLDGGVISAVNWAEVLQKVRVFGRDPGETSAIIQAHGIEIEPADEVDAFEAALLWDPMRPLSLADRFCLALGARLRATVMTADRVWTDVDADVDVRVIR